MPNKLNVILTDTDNTYLQPRLPLAGEIELFELGLHSAIITAVFRIREDDGRLSAPVEISNPTFTYDHAAATEAGRLQRAYREAQDRQRSEP